jgi:hypothetical protein
MDAGPEGDLERRKFVGSGNDGFACLVCGLEVLPLRNGSFRSHCPACLWSRHVDEAPGDRASSCGGLMRPVALEGSASGGWTLIHVCDECGARRRNRTAEDDPRQPDSWERMMEVSAGIDPA